MVRAAFFLLFLLFPVAASAQFLLQQLNFANPVILKGAVNSDAEELYPIAAGNRGLFFVRAFHKDNKGGLYGGQDIWQAAGTQSPKEFLEPSNRKFRFTGKENNAVVGISEDGTKIWIMSSYPVADGRKIGLSTSVFHNDKWSEPVLFDIPQLQFVGEFLGVHVADDGRAVFLSMQSAVSVGKEDIYIIYKNGNEWVGPVNIGMNVNSSASEISPFFDAKRNLLFFSSDRRGGPGNMDIYLCQKLGDSWLSWSVPELLPEPVNSPFFEAYFSTSPDGDAYFASNRNGKMSDIFYTRIMDGEEPEVAEENNEPTKPQSQSENAINESDAEESFGMQNVDNDLIVDIDAIAPDESEDMGNAQSRPVSPPVSVETLANEPESEQANPVAPVSGHADDFANHADDSENNHNTVLVPETENPAVQIPAVPKETSEISYSIPTQTLCPTPATPVSESDTHIPESVSTQVPESANSEKTDERPEILRSSGISELPFEARRLRSVYFAFEKVLPKSTRDYAVLDTVARIMRENPGLVLQLSGHTDNIGSHAVNVRFSKMRAEKVREQLIKLGVDPTCMELSWHAYDRPAASNSTASGRALNRRTELMFKLKD